MKKHSLSVVIPVYNSEAVFPELYRRLSKVLKEHVREFEILCVVDGCPDRSADVIATFCENDPTVKLIELSRNFGHQAAITAGLDHALYDILIMDDDLEDPPEVIPQLIAKAEEGFEVVYGIRKRRRVSLFRRLSYHFFYRSLNRMTKIKMPPDAGDFCLMKRPVVEALKAMPETNRYLRGMRTWIGFSQTGIEYERGHRHAGRSGYSFAKYIRLALDAILSFSYKPLQYLSVFGSLIALISFILGIRIILAKMLGHILDVPGWASTIVAIFFLGGIQLLSIGILGQYIARIYDETKSRPKYLVKRRIGWKEGGSE
jgi:dolichol-phosphate mannosyltransferase